MLENESLPLEIKIPVCYTTPVTEHMLLHCKLTKHHIRIKQVRCALGGANEKYSKKKIKVGIEAALGQQLVFHLGNYSLVKSRFKRLSMQSLGN